MVALNAVRAAEEARGLVRWLRPEFQVPNEVRRATQAAMDVETTGPVVVPSWPGAAPEQFVALRAALSGIPLNARSAALRFDGAKWAKLGPMLETLVALGQARHAEGGRYTA